MELNHYWNWQHPLKPYTTSQPANPGSFPPDNASRTEPPEPGEGEWPAWGGQGWILVEDHRGKKGWVDGSPYEVKDFGPLPDGWTDEQPPPTPEQQREAQRAAILAALDELDRKSMRSVRAIGVLSNKLETADAGDRADLEAKLASEEVFLAGLEDQAEAKRAELAALDIAPNALN